VLELGRDQPKNLPALWDFFTSGHPMSWLGGAQHIAADAISIAPFGNHDYVLALNRSPWQIAVTGALLVARLAVAVRVRSRLLVAPLAASAVIGLVLGSLSLTQTDGPVSMYFAVWLAYAPLAVPLAIGAGLSEQARRGLAVRRACAALAVLAVVLDLGLGSGGKTSGSAAGAAADGPRLGRPVAGGVARHRAGDRTVGFTIGSPPCGRMPPGSCSCSARCAEHGRPGGVGGLLRARRGARAAGVRSIWSPPVRHATGRDGCDRRHRRVQLTDG